MKKNIFKKSLIIGLICLLIIPSIAVVTGEGNSNYNLKIKIKDTKFFYKPGSLNKLWFNVSNEGPDFSDNYSVIFNVYRIGFRASHFITLHFNGSFTGSPIAPNGYEKTNVSFINWDTNWYIARAIVNSNDTNQKDNVSYCFFRVVSNFP